MCKKRIEFIILLLITISCNDKVVVRENIIEIIHFEKEIPLKGEDCASLRDDIYPLTMGIKNDMLLLCDGMSDPHLYIYKLPLLEFLGEYVNQGKGPEEMLDPIFWGQFNEASDSTSAWFYEPNRMRYSLVSIDKLIKDSDNILLETHIMPPRLGAAVNLIKLDKYIVAGGRSLSGEFIIYDPETKEKKWAPFINEFNSAFMLELKKTGLIKNIKQGVLKVKPDRSYFVKAYSYLPIVDIYDSNARLKFSIINNKIDEPDINFRNKTFNPDTKIYNTNVFLTDRFIYVANNNCTLQELVAEDAKNVLIEVYTWEGVPKIRFELNEGIGPMAPFVVDEKNEMIYTMNPQIDGRCFSQFDIEGMLPMH